MASLPAEPETLAVSTDRGPSCGSVSPPSPQNPRLGIFLQTLQRTIRTLERRYEEQRRLREATTHANFGVMLDDILDKAYEAFRPLIPYERLGLALLEDEGQIVRSRWIRSETEPVFMPPGYFAPMGGNTLQLVMDSGRPRIINDLAAYLEAHPESESTRILLQEGFLSNLTCPLVAMGKPVGFLFFTSVRPNSYNESHIEVFGQLSQHVSMIVEKGRMYEDLQRTNERLEAEVRQRARTEQTLRKTQAELESANRVLAALAATDGLTGVANRRAFDEYLLREWRRAIRTRTELALVMIDIDAFKHFNDTHGHLAGDDCLRAVAETLNGCVRRPCDLVARYGGEEFAVLLPETGLDPALMLAERMRGAVEELGIEHRDSPGGDMVTISLGATSATPVIGDEPEALIRSCDRALYLAKQRGRNRVACDEG